MEPPLCTCGNPGLLREVRKAGPNQGRHFWGCVNWPEGCRLFKWASAEEEAAAAEAAGSQRQSSQAARSPASQQPSWQSPHAQPPSQPWQSPPSAPRRQAYPSQQQQQQQQQRVPPPASPHQQQQPQARGPAPRIASPASLAASGRPYVPMWDPEAEGPPGAAYPHASPQQQQQRQQQQGQASRGGSQPATPPGSSHGWGGPPSLGGSQPQPSQQQHPLYGRPQGSQPPSQQPYSPRQAQGASPAGRAAAAGPSPQGERLKVSLQVVDGDTFGAAFRYNEPLKEFVKSFPRPYNGRWDPQRKLWTFPMPHYEDVLQLLQEQSPVPLALNPIPPGALSRHAPAPPGQHLRRGMFEQSQQVQHLSEDEVDDRLARLPSELWNRLYGFQREGVGRGVALGGRVLLGDEMGLGKTVQALCIAACFGPEDWPLLIICPSTMKLVWQDAVRHWLPPDLTPRPHNLAVIKDGQGIDQLLGRMDQETPNLDTQRTQAVKALVEKAARAILVTGTPALSRPWELYPQASLI
ncbi:hypothetical protein CHLNCDRAFT_136835 [Chlorella variabilis]|uniref:Uncharacterized protein n=1 Tax=Chlorella variabilis TaxID=554065 RepID=E1ZL58_CHLVA|nr:hypothetical protein CHLNCDRAFT_136835 [Chlorella variabilis]EFN53502.1 hypothetical protein CHLNCDRAFT_136835 [Chlorella variabilis]|eukprot:XP_005845604.1 hypothetical protein CHLNCDRAFT_136835 [Chlorella variabilis]